METRKPLKRKFTLEKVAACIVFASLLFSSAYSQSDTANLENLSLKELLNLKITTASRTSQALDLASAVVIVISKEQIKTRGYQSLLDVLYDLPDMKVDDKMYSGTRNTFTLRGIEGAQKFVILLNGTSISSPSGEAMPIMENYPVHFAEQIEILYGPASALYGANAASGVINIITKKAPGKKDLNVEASSAAGTYGYTNTTLYITKKIKDRVSFSIAGQYYYDHGPDLSKAYKNDTLFDMTSHQTGIFNTIYGPVKPLTPVKPGYEAPMEAYNVFATLQAGDFSFNYFRNYFKLPNGFENNPNNTVFNKEVFMAQSNSMANAAFNKSFGKITSTTSLTASEYNLHPESNYRNLYTAMEPVYKYATCSMVRAEEQLDYKASEHLSMSAGAAYESYNAIPQSADLAAPVNTKDYIHGSYAGTEAFYRPEGLAAQFYFIKYYNVGSFFQAQYSLNQKIHITAGARYDRNSRYGASFNPRMGIVYKPAPGTTIKMMYGSAFLAPAPSTSYVQYGSFETIDSGKSYHSYFLHLPNPRLKPIRSYNTELNISQQLSDNIIISVDGYYTILTGLLSTADDNTTTRLYNNMFNGIPVDYVEVFINRKKQRNYGGSIQLIWKYNLGDVRLNSYASCSVVNGVINNGPDEFNKPTKDMGVDFISPVMVRLGTDLKAGNFTCSPRLLIMGRQNIAGISDTTGAVIKRQTLAGYQLLTISMKYRIARQFSVFAKITNALNQRYRCVSYNMDLQNKNTELFYGQPQDPIRVIGGFNFNL